MNQSRNSSSRLVLSTLRPLGSGLVESDAIVDVAPRPLGRGFYAQPVLSVARQCIGKVLVHRTIEGDAAGRIVEARGVMLHDRCRLNGPRSQVSGRVYRASGRLWDASCQGSDTNPTRKRGRIGEDRLSTLALPRLRVGLVWRSPHHGDQTCRLRSVLLAFYATLPRRRIQEGPR